MQRLLRRPTPPPSDDNVANWTFCEYPCAPGITSAKGKIKSTPHMSHMCVQVVGVSKAKQPLNAWVASNEEFPVGVEDQRTKSRGRKPFGCQGQEVLVKDRKSGSRRGGVGGALDFEGSTRGEGRERGEFASMTTSDRRVGSFGASC